MLLLLLKIKVNSRFFALVGQPGKQVTKVTKVTQRNSIMNRVKITFKKQPVNSDRLKKVGKALRALVRAGVISKEEHDIRWRNLLKQEQKYLLANPR